MPTFGRSTSYVGDDDSTTLAELVKQAPYELHKYLDIIHIKRSLSTCLYNLSQRIKFPKCSTLSQKVINYLVKCFSYSVHQNKDDKPELSKSSQLFPMVLVTTASATAPGADFIQIPPPMYTMSYLMERTFTVMHLKMLSMIFC